MSNSYHSHIAKGSMKDAHNLDDRQERSQVCKRETQQVKPISPTAAKKITINLESIRAALREREAQEKLNNQ